MMRVRRVTRKIVLTLLCLAGVALVLTAVLLAILPTLLQSDYGRTKVASLLSHLMGTVVRFDGDVSIELGRTLKLRITDLKLLQPAGFHEGEMLTLAEGALTLDLGGTIIEGLTFGDIELKGVTVRSDAKEGGVLNWSLIGGSKTNPSTESSTISLPRFSNIRLTDVELTLAHLTPARSIHIKELLVTPQGEGRGHVVTMTMIADHVPLTMNGAISGLDPSRRTGAPHIALSVVKGAHTINCTAELLNERTVRGNLELKGDNSEQLTAPWYFGVPRWAPYRVLTDFEYQLSDDPTLAFKGLLGDLNGLKVSADGYLNLSREANVRGRMKILIEDGEVKGDLQLGGDGSVSGDLSSHVRDLYRLSPLFLTELPRLKNFSLDGTFAYHAASKVETFPRLEVKNFDLRIAQSDAKGSLSFRFNPFGMQGEIASKELHIPSILEELKNTFAPKSSHETTSGEDIFILPFTAPSGIEVSAGRIVLPDLPDMRDVEVSAKFGDRLLQVVAEKGTLLKGDVKAKWEMGRGEAHFTVDAAGISSEELYAYWKRPPSLSGLFSLNLDLMTKADTLVKAWKGLRGSISLRSDSAQLKSKILAVSASGLGRILSPLFRSGEETPSDCLLLNYQVESGIARSEDNVVKIGDAFVFGKGQIDLIKASLAYNFYVNSSNPSLASLIPPFRAFGSLVSPYFVPSASGAVASVFDSAEGVFDTAFGALKKTTSFVFSWEQENLKGVEVCRKAAEKERARLSSMVGKLVPGG